MRPRVHTPEFKLTLMRQLASGEKRPAQVCREHQLADSVLSRWRKEYAVRGEAAFSPQAVAAEEAKDRRIAALERVLGQLALEHSALRKGLQSLGARSGTRC